jgi:hypothetical protein
MSSWFSYLKKLGKNSNSTQPSIQTFEEPSTEMVQVSTKYLTEAQTGWLKTLDGIFKSGRISHVFAFDVSNKSDEWVSKYISRFLPVLANLRDVYPNAGMSSNVDVEYTTKIPCISGESRSLYVKFYLKRADTFYSIAIA